ALDGSLSAIEDTPATGKLIASDADGNALTYSILAGPGKGAVTITNPSTGAYTYTPAANLNGSDMFTFKVNDGTADSNVATITVAIQPVNDVPTANDDPNQSTPEDTPLVGTLAAIDVDGDGVTYAIVANGRIGSVS